MMNAFIKSFDFFFCAELFTHLSYGRYNFKILIGPTHLPNLWYAHQPQLYFILLINKC